MINLILSLFLCLIISESISSDEKVKVCRIKDRLITARKTDLYELVDAINLQEIILQCHYCFEKGNLDAKIWYKQVRPFMKDPEEIKLTNTFDPNLIRIMINPEHSLIIKNYSYVDEGIYYCHGEHGWETEHKFNYLVDTVMNVSDMKSEVGDALGWIKYQDEYLKPINKIIQEKMKEYKYPNVKFHDNGKFQLEAMTQWEPWGPCIVCGLPIGQRRRKGKCRLHATKMESKFRKGRHVPKPMPGEDESTPEINPTEIAAAEHDIINTSSPSHSEKFTIDEIFSSTPILSCRSLQMTKSKEIPMGVVEKIAAIPDYVQIESCYGVCEEGTNSKTHLDGKGKETASKRRVWEDELSEEARKEAEREAMEEYLKGGTRAPREKHLKKGDRLRLVCPRASASSVVVWKKNGKVIGASGLMDYSNVDALGTLHIESVDAKDTGSYLCSVDGEDRLVVSVQVKVSKFPDVEDYIRHSTYIFIIFIFISVIYCSRVVVEYYSKHRRHQSGYHPINRVEDDTAESEF